MPTEFMAGKFGGVHSGNLDDWVPPLGCCCLDRVGIVQDGEGQVRQLTVNAHDADGTEHGFSIERTVEGMCSVRRDGRVWADGLAESPITGHPGNRARFGEAGAWALDQILENDAAYHRGDSDHAHDRWGGDDVEAMIERSEMNIVAFDESAVTVDAARDAWGGLRGWLREHVPPAIPLDCLVAMDGAAWEYPHQSISNDDVGWEDDHIHGVLPFHNRLPEHGHVEFDLKRAAEQVPVAAVTSIWVSLDGATPLAYAGVGCMDPERAAETCLDPQAAPDQLGELCYGEPGIAEMLSQTTDAAAVLHVRGTPLWLPVPEVPALMRLKIDGDGSSFYVSFEPATTGIAERLADWQFRRGTALISDAIPHPDPAVVRQFRDHYEEELRRRVTLEDVAGAQSREDS